VLSSSLLHRRMSAARYPPVRADIISFTSDFHAPETACHDAQRSRCWANASILNVNLSHPRLLAAARQLAPAVWRIGGSPADLTTYGGFGVTQCPHSCAGAVKAACGGDVFHSEDTCKACLKHHGSKFASCAATNPGFVDICKNGGDDAFYCLTPERWEAVLRFAARVGVRPVFGINYASPSVWSGNGTDAHWDVGNARELLQYSPLAWFAVLKCCGGGRRFTGWMH
jgi:hypothetical protein